MTVKVIGLLVKILLFDHLGEDGMAYFNAAYTIYSAFFILSTAGFPVAVSILISESRARGDIKRVKQIFWIAFSLFVLIGFTGMAIMFGGADFFAEYIRMPSAAQAIRAISPTLFLICISSAIRGYFQGYQIMFPTAVSQVIEACGKLFIGIALAKYALDRGYSVQTAAAYAIFGVSIGVAISMLFLIVTRVFYRPCNELVIDAEPTRSGEILRRLISIAVPVTISALVMSLTQIIDTLLIVSRLQDAGFVAAVAERMYGNYTTLVIPLFNLTPALITPISMALVPMLTLAIKSGDRNRIRESMDSALRLTILIALPCAIGLCVFSRPILLLLFSGSGESVEMAAPLLATLAISVLFVALLNVTNSILQAYGQERKPIYSMLAGSAIKIFASYILLGIPSINLFGAPIGTFLCHLTATAINFYFIARYTHHLGSVMHLFFKPLLAAVGGIGGALGIYLLLASRLGESKQLTLCAIGLAMLAYFTFILCLRAVTEKDVQMLPGGEKLAGILKRLKLLK
ncbi:MAG: polysaccharide biosynthesis protein [Clostridia bacterium]|nr:polysaccharide biosynthesis protein [Clostridia bacterium]